MTPEDPVQPALGDRGGADAATQTERRTVPNSCGGCDATWTGTGRAHCAASGCHRLFATVALFDAHRSARGPRGACIDPEAIRHGKTGERLMFHRNGMWRGPEMTPEQKAKAFGGSAA